MGLVDDIVNSINNAWNSFNQAVNSTIQAINSTGQKVATIVQSTYDWLKQQVDNAIKAVREIYKFGTSDEATRIQLIASNIQDLLNQNKVNQVISVQEKRNELEDDLDYIRNYTKKQMQNSSNGINSMNKANTLDTNVNSSSLLDQIKALIRSFDDSLKSKFADLGNVVNNLKTEWDKFTKDPIGYIKGLGQWAEEQLKNKIGNAGEAIGSLIQGGVDILKGFVDSIGNGLSSIWDSLSNIFSEAYNWLKEKWDNATKGISDLFSGAYNWMKEQYDNATKGISDAWDKLTTGFNEWIKGIKLDLFDIFAPALNYLLFWFNGFWDLLGLLVMFFISQLMNALSIALEQIAISLGLVKGEGGK